MICYNLPLLCYANRAQDAPKTLQDTSVRPRMPQGAPETPPGHAQETPRCAQDASQGAPKTLSEAPKTPQDTHTRCPKTRQRRPDEIKEPSRPPPDLDFGPFWRRCFMICLNFEGSWKRIWIDFWFDFKAFSRRASVH